MRAAAERVVPYLALIIIATVVLGAICAGLYLAHLVEEAVRARRNERALKDARTDLRIRSAIRYANRRGWIPEDTQ